jgi:hypothetical protein
MRTISFGGKHKNLLVSEDFVQYLILSSEPKETASLEAGRRSFDFPNRYIAKRRVMRTIRRLRRSRV